MTRVSGTSTLHFFILEGCQAYRFNRQSSSKYPVPLADWCERLETIILRIAAPSNYHKI